MYPSLNQLHQKKTQEIEYLKNKQKSIELFTIPEIFNLNKRNLPITVMHQQWTTLTIQVHTINNLTKTKKGFIADCYTYQKNYFQIIDWNYLKTITGANLKQWHIIRTKPTS